MCNSMQKGMMSRFLHTVTLSNKNIYDRNIVYSQKVYNVTLYIFLHTNALILLKLDGVGPVDNRPSTD